MTLLATPRTAVETRLTTPLPNPSWGPVRLGLTLADAARVRVAVYDALGREVAVVHDGALGAGSHACPVAAGRLPAGVYLVRAVVTAGGAAPEALQSRFTVVR